MTVKTASDIAREPRKGAKGSNGTQAGHRLPDFDVVGLGLNATDTLLIVPHFPAYAGKVPFEEEHLSDDDRQSESEVRLTQPMVGGPG